MHNGYCRASSLEKICCGAIQGSRVTINSTLPTPKNCLSYIYIYIYTGKDFITGVGVGVFFREVVYGSCVLADFGSRASSYFLRSTSGFGLWD